MRLPAELVATLRPAYEGRPVCVTGGAGFIGGHTVDALVSLGALVTVIDDLSTSTLDHLAELIDLEPQRVRFIHASILEPRALAQAVNSAQLVFHLAAMGSVPRSVAEPARAMAVNTAGTVAVLEAARAVGVQRVIFASSSSVYGGGPAAPSPAPDASLHPSARREDEPLNPLSPYAASKAAAELALRAWSRTYGLSSVSLRYFNVFGPRQSAESDYAAVIPAFARGLLAGKAPTIFGDGRQSRDFTYVANVVAANLLAGASTERLDGLAINIGAGLATDLLELHRLLAEQCGVPYVGPAFGPERAGDVRHSLADITLAARLLRYRPFISLAAGLADTVDWARRVYASA